VHPLYRAAEQRFLKEVEARGAKVAVLDVPLLFETGGDKRVDAILARQLPDAEKRKRADFVVDTSHGLDPVRARIRDILAEVAKMPRRRT